MYNAAPAGSPNWVISSQCHGRLARLQDGGDRVDDPDIRVGLAVYDDLVLEPHAARDVEEVFLRETVIPAAVPDHQLIGVLLPGSRKLSAGELFHVEITVRVGIGLGSVWARAFRLVNARDAAAKIITFRIFISPLS